jgi:hypothetical protein
MRKQANELVGRVRAETPGFFKKVRKYGFIIAGLGLLLKVATAAFPTCVPAGLAGLAPEIMTFGLTVAGVSTTAKK